MTDACETTGASSEDRQVVSDYLRSGRYAQRMQSAPRLAIGRQPSPIPLEGASWSGSGFAPEPSYWFGLLGLNILLIVFAGLTPVGMESFEWFFSRGRPSYVVMMLALQTLMFPAIIGYSFITVTPMFWYGSVIVRFATAAVSVIPPCVAFVLSMAVFEEVGWDDDFFGGFVSVMFAQFLVAGTISLIVQLWSPWTLSHARGPGQPIPPLGTFAMMELMVVAAVCFAIFALVDTLEYLEGLLFFAAFGAMSSVAVISVQAAFLREGARSRVAIGIAGLTAFLTAVLFSGTLAALEYGWESIPFNLLTVAAVSLYGAMIVFGVIWICIQWLRFCGWRCVNRRAEGLVTNRHAVHP